VCAPDHSAFLRAAALLFGDAFSQQSPHSPPSREEREDLLVASAAMPVVEILEERLAGRAVQEPERRLGERDALQDGAIEVFHEGGAPRVVHLAGPKETRDNNLCEGQMVTAVALLY
jgi:hypothetical protein